MNHSDWTDLLFLSDVLKDLPRIGWALSGLGKNGIESIADHSWAVAYISLLMCGHFSDQEENVDVERVLTMAIIHDLAEGITSDIPHRGSADGWYRLREAKSVLETEIISEITRALPNGESIRKAWEEYIEGATIEARIVQSADIIDMLNRALSHEKRGASSEFTEQFFESGVERLRRLKIDIALQIAEDIISARRMK